jgi:hypothetical protein
LQTATWIQHRRYRRSYRAISRQSEPSYRRWSANTTTVERPVSRHTACTNRSESQPQSASDRSENRPGADHIPGDDKDDSKPIGNGASTTLRVTHGKQRTARRPYRYFRSPSRAKKTVLPPRSSLSHRRQPTSKTPLDRPHPAMDCCLRATSTTIQRSLWPSGEWVGPILSAEHIGSHRTEFVVLSNVSVSFSIGIALRYGGSKTVSAERGLAQSAVTAVAAHKYISESVFEKQDKAGFESRQEVVSRQI